VHDLREAEDRIVEAVVEAVDEDQNLAFGVVRRVRWNQASACCAVDHVGFQRHELGSRIARYLLRPLHLADLPSVRRRDRDRDVGEARRWSPVARNISAGSTRLRVVATSMSTRLAPATVPLTGTITPRTLAQALRPDTKARIKGRCAT
jgi:hypothetical protein